MGYLRKITAIRVPATAIQIGLHLVALAAFSTLALTSHRVAGYLLVLFGLLMVVARGPASGMLSVIPAVAVLAASVVAPLGRTPVSGFMAFALVSIIICQSALLALGRRPRVRATNLPGYAEPRRLTAPADTLNSANVVLVAATGAFGYAGWPLWPVAIAVGVECVAVAAVTADAAYRRMRGSADASALRAALDRYAPAFIVYFSGSPGQEYQISSWLPAIDAIGEPYLVVVREAAIAASLRSQSTAPVLHCPTVATVDATVVPSVRAVLYVNNASLNSHIARFSTLTHIQLLHGDSDKPASFNPVSAMFDRLFVAGPAAIQRYADHGVVIAEEKFDVVGRPQARDIRPDRAPESPTVLYAPTSPSQYADENHSSLEAGEAIVKGLIAAGATVILRGHPALRGQNPGTAQITRLERALAADRARTGRPHVFGTESRAMTAVEAMNASTAMVTDVSAMAVDYLASGKPLVLTDMRGAGPDFARHSPIGRAAYVIDKSGSNIADVIAEMLGDDPNAARRAAVREQYLAPDTFAETARRYVRGETQASGVAIVRPREPAAVRV